MKKYFLTIFIACSLLILFNIKSDAGFNAGIDSSYHLILLSGDSYDCNSRNVHHLLKGFSLVYDATANEIDVTSVGILEDSPNGWLVTRIDDLVSFRSADIDFTGAYPHFFRPCP